jgi:radical SAM-linked protein
VQKLRLRYTKRGRLRFTSHRDIARAFERALRRAQVPMAYSAGFSPHPKISWVGAAPTGVASEAEYVEISLAVRVEPDALRAALDGSLPAGIDVVEVVEAVPGTSLPDLVQASGWEVLLAGVEPAAAAAAVQAFLAAPEVLVQRLVKDGMRTLDARAAVVSLRASGTAAFRASGTETFRASGTETFRASGTETFRASGTEGDPACATLAMVVRHLTPAVRPDDVLSGLRLVADLETPVPPAATRVRQGPLTESGGVGDPLAPDRTHAFGETRQATDSVQVAAGAKAP